LSPFNEGIHGFILSFMEIEGYPEKKEKLKVDEKENN
jgi:hypothetical protein